MEQSVKQRIADIQQGNVPAGYRKIKLGIIPAGWNVELLGSIFVARDERVDNSFDTPLFSLTIEDGITAKTERYEREFLVKKEKNYKKVYPGDFVYNPMNLRFGAIARYHGNTPCSVSGYYDVFYLKNPSFYGDFIETLLQSDILLKEYANAATGSLIEKQRVHFSNFCKIGFMQPNELEITKIAKFLGCCDRVIALKKELIAEKKKQKKSLMQKLLNPDSGFRLPGFSGEWKSVMLSECVTLGKVKISPADCDKSCKCIELEHIAVESGKLLGHCSPERVQSLKTVFHKNDILFGKLRPYLKKIILAPFDGICCSECWVLKVAYNINPAFLYNRLFMDDFISASCTVSGTKMPRADWQYVKDFQLFIPEITEQQAIADILSAADKEIDLLEQELVQQEQKKKSLMQLLLTGIVRV